MSLFGIVVIWDYIWSLGVILYMLVCGVPPFQEANDSETLVMILDCRYSVPEHVSHDCRDLISRMLQKDPARRASLAQIEAHGWLQGLDNPLLSPEPPPYWLSGALSPTSTRSGASECGDLLASRPPGPHQASPGPWQPSLSLSIRPAPPTEEPPGGRGLTALQQICEEEEEEEDEEEEEEEVEGGSGDAEEKQEVADNQEVEDQDEDLGNFVEDKTETGSQDSRRVISDQPVNHADGRLAPPPLAPASPPPEISLSCCPGQPEEEEEDEEVEPNNNTNKNKPPPTPPPIPESDSCLSCGSASSGRGAEPREEPRGEEPKGAEPSGKQHGVKLRQRLFQFPLCEKALAFNLPSTNKPKILPLAQYNCCHVL
uniref:non-specific serine/threonine protein kinase n=1 Tax=Menidia menidia TaxID=238744 RepID=A0A8S4AQV8_9TELE|nr:unnamed protein product [Menidia menidia]